MSTSGSTRRRTAPLLRRAAGSRAGRLLRGNRAKAASALVTVLLFLLIVRVLSAWTVPVWYRHEKNSPAAVSSGFYALPKDSADVLFLGGSRAEAAYVPQFLYNERGITAYTLCAGDQGLRENYFWLQEALRFQGPKAVVLDISALTEGSETEAARKALTYMRWSRVKWEAVRTVTGDGEGTLLNWVFPGLWFHGRWDSLSEEDLDPAEAMRPDGLMGWSGQYTDRCGLEYVPVQVPETEAVIPEEAAEEAVWLDRIAALCRDKDIRLLLTVLPADDINADEHQVLRQICEERKLRLLDFGTAELYSRIGYAFGEDQNDGSHANVDGAGKLTSYVGLVLAQDYGLSAHSSARWEEGRNICTRYLREAELKEAADLSSFLEVLSTDGSTIFALTDGPISPALSGEDKRALLNLGIRTDLTTLNGRAWCAVPGGSEGGSSFREQTAEGELETEGLFRGRRSRYTLRSTGSGSAERAQLQIDGTVFTPSEHGLYFVVLDAGRNTVITEALFSGETGTRIY